MEICNGLALLAFSPLIMIILIYTLDPGAWERIEKGRRSYRPSGKPPGDKNIKRSRKK